MSNNKPVLELHIVRSLPSLAIVEIGWNKDLLSRRLAGMAHTIEQLDNYIITTVKVECPEEWK